MYCGSCMHDNTWARALRDAGAEVTLIPTYTPVRVDEHDESLDRIFFGGINVYLNAHFRWWRHLPRFATRWLDHPTIIRWATSRSISNDATELGELTISMLQGDHGPHRVATEELARYISQELKPDVVIFSNALLSGAVPVLREQFAGRIICVLQGDDVFLDILPDQHRSQVMDLMHETTQGFHSFFTHSHFYRDYMRDYLSLGDAQMDTLPLGIDFTGCATEPSLRDDTFTVGYFARIAPEKGLHHLADAFLLLKKKVPDAKLKFGGFLGDQHQKYLDGILAQLASFGEDVEYIGSPHTHDEKVAFLQSIDVLSVPTEFQEPKGIYVMEALANGIPVVQPRHGAFPEIIEQTQGGLLVEPKNPQALADALASMADRSVREPLAQQGWSAVREYFSQQRMAERTLELLTATRQPAE